MRTLELLSLRCRAPLPTNHHVAEGILPAVEGRHPAARTCCHPFLRVDCFDAFSAGLEAPALRQAGCLPLLFRGSKRDVLFRRILSVNRTLERRPPARLGLGSLEVLGRAGGRRSGSEAQRASAGRRILTLILCPLPMRGEEIRRRPSSARRSASANATRPFLSPSEGERIKVRGCFGRRLSL